MEELLPQVEEFKFLWYLLPEAQKKDKEIKETVAASAVMGCSVMAIKEMSCKAKLSMDWPVSIHS